MSAKQYLKQIWYIEGRVKRDKERLAELELTVDGMKAITYDKDKVQSSPIDMMSERIEELVDLKTKIVEEIAELEIKKSEVLALIHTLNNENMEQLLYLRYLMHQNFYEISDRMEYTLRQLHRIHAQALKEIDEKLSHNVT